MNSLKCDNMLHFIKKVCENIVTSIDSSGFLYCNECARIRSMSKKVRLLSLKNIEKIKKGNPLKEYEIGK